MKTKQQILNTIEPRSVKLIGVFNSWGSSTGDSGVQWLSEDYIKQSRDAMTVYDTQNDVLNQKNAWYQELLVLLQRLFLSLNTK